ncbi:TetR/AcrR family transcriptional regulator [Nakamurella flava]|uniref:TetR/AcrR family transcriptional regulator n=1 Tax=Nakamurella flava TaxID=2576308 RepID=A0A4U6QGN2_9ACTN|nr:TetR/AcrR family transcriptional regulator [Nakamurella flava]TKV59258.1 TetR/AcrR family transcriptional regulator [Nakamurella flava]
MADVKGGRRSYDGSGRQEKARSTRRAIVAAARELLEQSGFTGTSMAAVARRAGVSAESVYKAFGSKAALVKEVFDVTIAGDDEPVPVADRPEVHRIQQEPDARRKMRLYVQGAAERASRSAGIQLVLRNGAEADPAVARLWAQVQDERLAGMTMFARHLAETGCLAAGVDVEYARDVLWTCTAVEVYDLLVHQRGWALTAYADWLDSILSTSLLDPVAGVGSQRP